MKRLIAAIALTCFLSAPAFAGDIPMTVTAPTPTAPTQVNIIASRLILTILSLARY